MNTSALELAVYLYKPSAAPRLFTPFLFFLFFSFFIALEKCWILFRAQLSESDFQIVHALVSHIG